MPGTVSSTSSCCAFALIERMIVGAIVASLIAILRPILAREFSRDKIIEGVPGSSARDPSRATVDRLGEIRPYALHRPFHATEDGKGQPARERFA